MCFLKFCNFSNHCGSFFFFFKRFFTFYLWNISFLREVQLAGCLYVFPFRDKLFFFFSFWVTSFSFIDKTNSSNKACTYACWVNPGENPRACPKKVASRIWTRPPASLRHIPQVVWWLGQPLWVLKFWPYCFQHLFFCYTYFCWENNLSTFTIFYFFHMGL